LPDSRKPIGARRRWLTGQGGTPNAAHIRQLDCQFSGAHGRVANVTGPVSPPNWLVEWCRTQLNSPAVETVSHSHLGQMAQVFGVRLDDGREVVVKARPSEARRAEACVKIQRQLANACLPCASPITDAIVEHGMAVHAEEWRPGGSVRHDDGPEHAAQSAQVLAELMRVSSALAIGLRLPLPNPVWVRWDHDNPGAWPPHDAVDKQQVRTGIALPSWLEGVQQRVSARINHSSLPAVIGHADWEAQNLRWDGGVIHTIHDWDSLAALPEAALVGAACGAFASTDTPTLAPLPSSKAFIAAYEEAAHRRFTQDELEVAWAASMFPAAHNSRAEILFGHPPVAACPLREQSEERLHLAGVR
jgi:Ser/Thr protein kinase RdoA (MazF antagonist)